MLVRRDLGETILMGLLEVVVGVVLEAREAV
jgi:hypothetical protein